MNLFLLKCSNCGHDQKYHTDNLILTGKKKRCVYCGKTFSVRSHLVKRLE